MHGYIQIVRRGGLALLCALVLAASAHAQFETRIGVSAVASQSSIAVRGISTETASSISPTPLITSSVFLGKKRRLHLSGAHELPHGDRSSLCCDRGL